MDSKDYILISGASSGIGQAIAIQLAARHRLILHGRNLERLNATQSLCGGPSNCLQWRYDLRRVDGLAASLTECLLSGDAEVSAFVHCASMLKMLPLRSIELEGITETMNANFVAAAEIVRVLIKKKVNQRTLASIVFVSSIAARFGAKAFSIYGASKGALDALMRSLAVELAPQVRANSVLPGAIRTPMTGGIFADSATVERLRQDYPLGLGEPADIANVVEFLLSDKARWITGQQITVDGGRTTNISA